MTINFPESKIWKTVAALTGVAVFTTALAFFPTPAVGAVGIGLGFVAGRWV